MGKNNLLTNAQKDWVKIKLKLLNIKPLPSREPLSNHKIIRFCHKIAMSNKFEVIIFSSIIVNTIVLTLHWYD